MNQQCFNHFCFNALSVTNRISDPSESYIFCFCLKETNVLDIRLIMKRLLENIIIKSKEAEPKMRFTCVTLQHIDRQSINIIKYKLLLKPRQPTWHSEMKGRRGRGQEYICFLLFLKVKVHLQVEERHLRGNLRAIHTKNTIIYEYHY